MKLKEILVLDIREKEAIKELQNYMLKLSWFKSFKSNNITIEVLEKLYWKITQKYSGRISYIQHASKDS